MFHFNYYAPTQVVFGKDTEEKTGELVKAQNCKKVLIHYGSGSVKRTGLLDRVKQALEKEYLKQYAREQRLTGIIVLNDKNKQIAQYHTGPKFKKVLGYVMEKETLRDVKNYPQKSYMARIELNIGGYIELASYGSKYAKGTVIGYQYVKTEYAKNNNLTIQNVLAGYKRENDGTIVITNGNDIIASNDEKLIDTKVQESCKNIDE